MGVVKDGGADNLARYPTPMSAKQAATLITTESLGKRTSCLERAMNSMDEGRKEDTRPSGRTRKFLSFLERRRHSRVSRKGARIIG